jgi:hypothetical protein
VSIRRALLVIATSLSLLGQQFRQFQTLKWETPYDQWRKAHPAAACRQFDGGSELADEQWCYRCLETTGPESYEWSFYAFDVSAPACRLGQVRAWQTGPGIAETLRNLEAALTARYGAPDTTNAVGESSSGFWRDIQHFRAGEGEVYLYRRVVHGQPDAAEQLARSSQLVAAKAEDKTLTKLNWDQLANTRTPLDQRLIKDLGSTFPGVGTLLAEDSDEKRRPVQIQTLQNLLAAVASAAPERKPELLLAADRVANLIPESQTGDPSSNRRTRTFSGFQLNYVYNPLGSTWSYQHDLLNHVRSNYARTEWADKAFLLFERNGWDSSGNCSRGSDQFRIVIAEAGKFLADHATGPDRTEVMLATGQAYETWWSLSHATPKDDYVQPEKYREGRETALKRAIGIYEQVATLAPQSLEAAYARRQLPRLKLGLDTMQRRFFCVYD